MKALQARSLAILDRAERAGDLRIALAAIREARGVMELLKLHFGGVDPVSAHTLTAAACEVLRDLARHRAVHHSFPNEILPLVPPEVVYDAGRRREADAGLERAPADILSAPGSLRRARGRLITRPGRRLDQARPLEDRG